MTVSLLGPLAASLLPMAMHVGFEPAARTLAPRMQFGANAHTAIDQGSSMQDFAEPARNVAGHVAMRWHGGEERSMGGMSGFPYPYVPSKAGRVPRMLQNMQGMPGPFLNGMPGGNMPMGNMPMGNMPMGMPMGNMPMGGMPGGNMPMGMPPMGGGMPMRKNGMSARDHNLNSNGGGTFSMARGRTATPQFNQDGFDMGENSMRGQVVDGMRGGVRVSGSRAGNMPRADMGDGMQGGMRSAGMQGGMGSAGMQGGMAPAGMQGGMAPGMGMDGSMQGGVPEAMRTGARVSGSRAGNNMVGMPGMPGMQGMQGMQGMPQQMGGMPGMGGMGMGGMPQQMGGMPQQMGGMTARQFNGRMAGMVGDARDPYAAPRPSGLDAFGTSASCASERFVL